MHACRHRISARLGASALAGALLCGGVPATRAQDAGGADPPMAPEVEEARAALRAAVSRNVELGIALREQEEVNGNLGRSLAAANAEAGRYRKAYEELRLQMEALGVEAVEEGTRGISEKLMKAVADLRILQKDKETLAERLAALSEAAIAYMRTAVSSNVEARAAVEASLREADEALGLGEARPPRAVRAAAEGGRVVSVKRELGVFVIDLGAKSGVSIGMPFEILRKDRPIGSAFVVDVRDHVCGATVSRLASDDDGVQVGDEVRLDTRAGF